MFQSCSHSTAFDRCKLLDNLLPNVGSQGDGGPCICVLYFSIILILFHPKCCVDCFNRNIRLKISQNCCMKPPVRSLDVLVHDRWDLPFRSTHMGAALRLPCRQQASSPFAIEEKPTAVKCDGRRRHFVSHGRIVASIFHDLR